MSGAEAPKERERLGWLTESAVQPRKRRMIEGVGAAGILDLKAALYKEQQEALQAKEDPAAAAARKSRRTAGIDLSQHARKNAGVEERDRHDRKQIKTPAARLAESYSALERKAQLYDRLASGQHEDEDELYNVDFVRKGTLDDEDQEMGSRVSRDTASHAAIDSAAAATRKRGMTSADMEIEQQRRQWEEDEWNELEFRKQEEARRDDKIEALERIEEETQELRQRLARRKEQKEVQAQQQREKIKAAFLKRQVAERIKAATKQTQGQ